MPPSPRCCLPSYLDGRAKLTYRPPTDDHPPTNNCVPSRASAAAAKQPAYGRPFSLSAYPQLLANYRFTRSPAVAVASFVWWLIAFLLRFAWLVGWLLGLWH